VTKTKGTTKADYEAALSNAHIDLKSLVVDEKGTLFTPRGTGSSPGSSTLEIAHELTMKGSISRGGMGRIMLAQQVSIGREVAVKMAAPAKDGSSSNAHENNLVVEARVAGQLEHPNIVPVHILGTADGKPVIVMKRIEGETWKQLLREKRDIARDVAVLMDVCRALHFAHERGVVHRDVKPANVMVGKHGEVYLLDWGIAVGIGERGKTIADLPHAADVSEIAGTPQYMAPEMSLPAPGAIDARTDVYLVGATLFEALTGAPPHKAETTEDCLFLAHVGDDPAARLANSHAPEELAAICAKAMSRDPEERFATIAEVRSALASFQSHASSRDTCAAAEERLDALASASDDDAQRIFNECRFGFALALRTWPESTRAQAGLQRALATMARREVKAAHFDSARALLAELVAQSSPTNDSTPADLDDVKAALAAHDARIEADAANKAELERIAHEADPNVAGRERALVVFGSAVSWFAMLITMDLLARNGTYLAASGTFATILGSIAILVALAGVVMPSIRATAASRSLYFGLLACVVGLTVLHTIGWVFEQPPAPMLALGHTLLAVSMLTVAAHDTRIVRGSLLTALIPVVIAAAPSLVYLASGVGTLISLGVVALAWRRPTSSH
jgi:serine/threonine-protein kinase